MQKKFFWVLTVLLVNVVSAQQAKNPLILENAKAQRQWVDSIYSSLSLDQKIGQLFMLDVFSSASPVDIRILKEKISTYQIGGLIFSKGTAHRQVELTNEFRKVHQFTTFSVSTPMQCGVADFLKDTPGYCEELPAFYQEKRDLFCSLLEGSRFRLRPAKSTFFQLLDYGAITAETDEKLATRWTREIGVASIPLTVFCETPFTGTRLRFCFAKDDATLKQAAEKLCEL